MTQESNTRQRQIVHPADKAMRVRMIYQLMLSNDTKAKHIFRYVQALSREMDWNVSRRTLTHYITLAKEMLDEYTVKEVKYYKRLHLMRLEDLYRRQLESADYRGAKTTLDGIAALLGLNAPLEVDITHAHADKGEEELIQEIEHLDEQLRRLGVFSTN